METPERIYKLYVDGLHHHVEERSDSYHRYYVAVNHEGEAVTGPTFSRLEALEWCAKEDLAYAEGGVDVGRNFKEGVMENSERA